MSLEKEPAIGGWKSCLPFVGIVLGCSLAAGLFFLATTQFHAMGLDRRWMIGAGIIYGFVIIGIIAIGVKAAQKLNHTKPSPALRRYNRDLMIAMTCYVLVLMLAISVFAGADRPSGALAYALALAPSIPLVVVIGLLARYLRDETDEFQRVLMLHSALVGTCVLLVLSTMWGFLEMFKLAPHLPSWCAFPIWCGAMGLGRFVLSGRYK